MIEKERGGIKRREWKKKGRSRKKTIVEERGRIKRREWKNEKVREWMRKRRRKKREEE